MTHILVTGGAGFIGSHMVKALTALGRLVVVVDDLSAGHRDAVPDNCLIIGSVADRAALDEIFGSYEIDAVIHFAGFIEVGRSVKDPLAFYRNNVGATVTLLE